MEIQELKTRLSILEVASHLGIKPDKTGKALCPFHDDKNPSLQLSKEKNIATCFSSACDAGTMDIIKLTEKKLNLSTHQALKQLTEWAGEVAVNNEQLTMSNEKPRKNDPGKIALLTKVFSYFKEDLKKSKEAQEYLKSRGIGAEAGYNSGNFYEKENKYFVEAAVKYGLLKEKSKGYQVFGKGCIAFPLRNKEKQITGIYFRETDESKSNHHYYLKERKGLYPSYPKPAATKLILTESIIDTATLLKDSILATQYPVLACYGTNGFTEEHLRAIEALKELEEVIIFFDGDEAGREGAIKISEQLTMLSEQLKITIVNTPEGEDINSLAQSHEAGILTHLLEKRQPFSFSSEKKGETNEEPQALSPLEQLNLFTAPKSKLNTTNPDQITYQHGPLQLAVLGGISLQNLDRLRVTLKMTLKENESVALRQNLDLYHDDAVQKLIRRAAEKLETGTSHLSQALAELTNELERYRLEKLESLKQQTVKKKTLTLAELGEAGGFLRSPGLMERTAEALGKTGIRGESTNAMILYLAMSSRKSEDPVSVICLSGSGMGKSYLQEKVSECMPSEDKIENTQFTENSFYYFKREEIKGKIFLIEDLDGAEQVLYPIRELQTKKRISKTVTLKDSKGNLRTYTLVVEGPVCVIAATTREKIYEDNANRSLLIYLDQSKDQDEQIMHYQKAVRAGIINKEEEAATREKLANVQRILRPLKVINPYAPLIELPQEVFKPRRTIGLLLSFIEAITLYHQYQLKEENGSIKTEPEHIEWAFKLLKETLFRKSDELSGATRSFFESLKAHLKQANKKSFYCPEIRKPLGQNPRNVQRYLYELQQYGYVKVIGGNRYRKGYEYEVTEYNDYTTLKSSIDRKLEEIMERIKKERATVRQSATKAPLSHSKTEQGKATA